VIVDRDSQVRGTSPPTLAVERIAPEDWSGIAEWDDLVMDSSAPSVFLTRDWITAWWEAFEAGREPYLLRVGAPHGRTVGLAPLYSERLRIPATRLGLLGDRVVGSEYLGLVSQRGIESDVADAVARWLRDEGPRWHLAELSGLRDEDAGGSALETALGAGAARRDEEQHECSAITLPDDFEEYLAGLGSKFRRSYRQRTNKLLRSCEVRFFRTESESEIPAHLDVLFRLHQARWVEAGRSGVFADARMRAFYVDEACRLLRSGRLQFWHLEADGAIRASQFGFSYGGVLHSLQEAYDTNFRPPGVGGLGVVLRGHVLQRAMEEGLKVYDFLGGIEDHKLRWGAEVHRARRVRLGQAGPRGRAAWWATIGAESAREAVKSALPASILDRLRNARTRYRRRRGTRG
jgi:CelD/BcsL family acetyltransferase involved in cellulose biosynthesis